MHGTIVGHGYDDHSGRSYKIRLNEMGCTITRTKRHVKSIPIRAEDYLRNEMLKTN